MEVIVGNLKLNHLETGFTEYHKQIHDVNISVLGEISKLYPEAHVKLYEIYGEWGLIHETDNLISTFFSSFEVVEGNSPVNSSPINNRPKILVDNKTVELTIPALNLVEIDHPEEIPQVSGEAILKINYPITRKIEHELKETYMVVADVEDCVPENLLEKQLSDQLNKLDTLSHILLLKVLRGETLCG